ncbi:N/A [soil metagenome]
MTSRALAVALSLLGLLRCGAQNKPPGTPAPAPEGVTVLHDVEIGQGGVRTLHAELAYPTIPPTTPMPAVLWIHGGSWSGGSYKNNPIQWLATKGFFTASIEYRLSGEAKWPAQLQDCKLGVRWLRANAAIYNVDPNRIAVWGASAGGHLAACLGTMDTPQFEGRGGYERVDSHVKAVVDFAGPVDFTEGSAGIQTLGKPPEYESPGLVRLFGGSFNDKTAFWTQGSPIIYVKAGDPPFLIVHGNRDTTVPYEQSLKMDAALKKEGVPVEFITVDNGDHGMEATKGDPPANPDTAELKARVLEFLERNLKP